MGGQDDRALGSIAVPAAGRIPSGARESGVTFGRLPAVGADKGASATADARASSKRQTLDPKPLLLRAWNAFTVDTSRADRVAAALTLVALVVAGAFFCNLAALRYLSHHADAFDMGIEDQMMWSTLHGKLFGITLEPRLTTSYLGYHFEPISLIGPVLYLIDASPISLVVFKNVVVALGAIPAFWLARKHLGSAYAGLVFALVYLLFPGLEAAQLYDWHAYTLTAPFLLASFCFLETRRYGWLVVFLALAAATKENSPLDAVPLGAYLFVLHRRFRLGAALAVAGLAWFGVATYLIVPHFNSEGQAWLWTRYGGMGGSPLGALAHFLNDPQAILAPVPDDPNWRYLALLLAPVAWLTLLSPTALFLMLPALAVNVLTAYEPMHLIETYHYSAHLVPFVLLGAVYGIGSLAALFRRARVPGRATIVALSTVVLAATLVYHHYRGYSPLSGEFVGYPVTAHDRLGDQLAQRVARMVPLNAPISAQSNLYPHVSHRPNISMFPGIANARLIFLDVATLPNTTGINEGIHDQVRQVLASGAFGPVEAVDGYLILERGAPDRPLPDSFYSFARAAAPRITHPLDVLFGDRLELLGFDVLPGRDGKVDLRVYWRARQPIADDLFLTFYITDGEGHERGAALHREPANVWYPTNRWKPGEIVQVTTYNLPIGRRGKDFGVALGAQTAADPFNTAGRLRPVVLSAPHPMRTPGQGALLEVVTFRNDRDLLTEETGVRSQESGVGSQNPESSIQKAEVGNRESAVSSQETGVPRGEAQAATGKLTGIRAVAQGVETLLVDTVSRTLRDVLPASAGLPGGAAQPAPPRPERALSVRFDQGIGLRGYSVANGGREVDLTLFWTASGATRVPYTVFAHLVDRSGKLVAQRDSPPDGGLKATTAWIKGESIVDHLQIPLPANTTLGDCHLEIGLYDPVSGRRLIAHVGGQSADHLALPATPTR